MCRACKCKRSEYGQASVELIAAIPLVAVIAALMLQAMVSGHAWIVLNQAAGVAARDLAMAVARGESQGPVARRSARAALPAHIRARASVKIQRGRVTVARRMPVIPIFKPFASKLPSLVSSARYVQ